MTIDREHDIDATHDDNTVDMAQGNLETSLTLKSDVGGGNIRGGEPLVGFIGAEQGAIADPETLQRTGLVRNAMMENALMQEQRKQQEIANADYVDIRFGDYAASISTYGCALRSLEFRGQPLVETFAKGELPPLQCGVFLAPWPNRIADGIFEFEGEEYQLFLNEPERHNALHGLVHNVNWNIVAADSHAAVLTTRIAETEQWPWTVDLAITFRLDDDGLHILVEASTESRRAPFACGWHTYLNPQGESLADAELKVNVDKQLPLDPIRKLPFGPLQETELARDLARGLPLQDLLLDDCFSVARKPLVAKMVSNGRGVRMSCSNGVGWVQVFTADQRWDCSFPGGRRAVAVEPMSAPPNSLQSGDDVVQLRKHKVANFSIRLQAC